MSLRIVPLAVTEEALRQLWSTHADFALIGTRPSAGRLRSGSMSGLGPYDFYQVRAQSEYLRLVSIVEAFIDSCSSQLFDIRLRGQDKFFRSLTDAALDQSTINWENRRAAFKLYHGITLGDCAKYSDVASATQVRNAVAHGLGSLTRRQSKKDMERMRQIGIGFSGFSLRITAAALDRCVDSCAQFIRDVDKKVTDH